MERFEHGGDAWGHPGALDFSANLNPLGMPEEVERALGEHVHDFEAYPDPACRELVAGISRTLGIPQDWVLATAGATDLMSRVCLALRPGRVLVTAPCYSGYEQAAEQAGAQVVRYELREKDGFAVDEGFLAGIVRLGGSARGELAILATPGNPTGLTLALPFVERVLETAAEQGTVVLLDECFLDFTDAPSAVRLCGAHPNLIVMRAFTKTYAMAGLRLGYGVCADAGLLARLRAAGQPWAVSTPAQVAGVAALEARRRGYVGESRGLVARERAWLAGELGALGFYVVPGQANYLLFRACAGASGEAAGAPRDLCASLLDRGVLIRRCENYEGLDARWFRIAVRSHGDNERLVAALREATARDGRGPCQASRRGARPARMGER